MVICIDFKFGWCFSKALNDTHFENKRKFLKYTQSYKKKLWQFSGSQVKIFCEAAKVGSH